MIAAAKPGRRASRRLGGNARTRQRLRSGRELAGGGKLRFDHRDPILRCATGWATRPELAASPLHVRKSVGSLVVHHRKVRAIRNHGD
jgi:hypothetical protein